MKTNATFNLSKPTKRLLSTMTGEPRRLFKKAMIQAEYIRSTTDRVILTGRESKEK
jgi:hypothetical protein